MELHFEGDKINALKNNVHCGFSRSYNNNDVRSDIRMPEKHVIGGVD